VSVKDHVKMLYAPILSTGYQ